MTENLDNNDEKKIVKFDDISKNSVGVKSDNINNANTSAKTEVQTAQQQLALLDNQANKPTSSEDNAIKSSQQQQQKIVKIDNEELISLKDLGLIIHNIRK